MADNHVEINVNTRLGYELRGMIDALAKSQVRMATLKSVMDQQINGSDYTALEARFGLPTGKGSSFYALLAGAKANMDAATSLQLMLTYGEAVIP